MTDARTTEQWLSDADLQELISDAAYTDVPWDESQEFRILCALQELRRLRTGPEQQLSILHRTSHFRGDHATDVGIAIKPIPGETVEQLVQRLKLDPVDSIELRVAQ